MPGKHHAVGWYSRGYQPHLDAPGLTQFVTFRLADSVPGELLSRWRQEFKQRVTGDSDRTSALQRRIERYADAGHGACHLRKPELACILREALQHHDGRRYRLRAWCIMPNHVHVLVDRLPEGASLPQLVQTWKSWSATAINRQLGRSGTLWMRDYFDRYIRDQQHLETCVHYIRQNPVKAGLVEQADDWPWTGP